MRSIRLISREIDLVRLTPTEVADRVVDELLAVFRLGDVGRRDEDAWRAERQRPVADLAEAHLPPRHQRQVGPPLGVLVSQVLHTQVSQMSSCK